MAPYRVLVVDDSPFMRKIFSDLIVQDAQFVIAATAANGAEAVVAALEHRPDVITMDLEMPVMNGIEALQQITKLHYAPVIMLSGISEDNTRDTIKALQFGAIDFIRKPFGSGTGDISQVGELLLEKLRMAVATTSRRSRTATEHNAGRSKASPPAPKKPNIPTQTAGNRKSPEAAAENARLHKPSPNIMGDTRAAGAVAPTPEPPVERRRPLGAVPDKGSESTGRPAIAERQPVEPESKRLKPAEAEPPSKGAQSRSFKHIVAVGTSTGGPRALHEVICSLPDHFPAPVLVVQHMPPKFTKSLAQRLDTFSALKVLEAEENMKVSAGVVYIAPGGRHMRLAKGPGGGYYIRLTDEPQRNGHRPSVDVMFESLLAISELSRHAVILTGMGSDGAKGMQQLAEAGAASTIAESEETCIVYGMPRSAVEIGCVQTIAPLHQIAAELVQAVSK